MQHNDLLWLLSTLGLAGTVPGIAAGTLAIRSAWRGRYGPRGHSPLRPVGDDIYQWHERPGAQHEAFLARPGLRSRNSPGLPARCRSGQS